MLKNGKTSLRAIKYLGFGVSAAGSSLTTFYSIKSNEGTATSYGLYFAFLIVLGFVLALSSQVMEDSRKDSEESIKLQESLLEQERLNKRHDELNHQLERSLNPLEPLRVQFKITVPGNQPIFERYGPRFVEGPFGMYLSLTAGEHPAAIALSEMLSKFELLIGVVVDSRERFGDPSEHHYFKSDAQFRVQLLTDKRQRAWVMDEGSKSFVLQVNDPVAAPWQRTHRFASLLDLRNAAFHLIASLDYPSKLKFEFEFGELLLIGESGFFVRADTFRVVRPWSENAVSFVGEANEKQLVDYQDALNF